MGEFLQKVQICFAERIEADVTVSEVVQDEPAGHQHRRRCECVWTGGGMEVAGVNADFLLETRPRVELSWVRMCPSLRERPEPKKGGLRSSEQDVKHARMCVTKY